MQDFHSIILQDLSLIAALTIAIRPGKVNRQALVLPVATFFIVAALYAGIAYTTGRFNRVNGIIFLVLFVLYLVITVWQMKKHPDRSESEDEEEEAKQRKLWMEILLLVVGAAAIAFGANLLVNNGTLIASALGVPDSVIGLTMVALGSQG